MLISQDSKRFSHISERHYRFCVVFLGILLFALSLYDLLSPPISKTIWRQTQTAMLTENFVKEGFTFKGLFLNIMGREKPLAVYEFPVYNFVVGVLYAFFGTEPVWGKAASLTCSFFCMVLLIELVRRRYGSGLGLLSGLFFILSPIGLMMYTSFQPDMLGLMFIMLSLWFLGKWKDSKSTKEFILFSLTLLIAGLAKYPSLVPYLPLITLAFFVDEKRITVPDLRIVLIFSLAFVVPLVSWYFYSRAYLTDLGKSSRIIDDMFFIGDLSRFFSLSYYTKIAFTIPFLALSGAGILLFILGLRRMNGIQAALLAGIPFYFILIPTARDQWYYLLSCVPILALFMARGFSLMNGWSTSGNRKVVLSAVVALFMVGFFLCGSYALSKDLVSWRAAISLKQVSNPNDLVFFINMHDRGTGIGGHNPMLSYLSQRNGWNVQYTKFSIDDIISQVERSRDKGAKWVLVTYYTKDLEPWISDFLPMQFHRDPGVSYSGLNSPALIEALKYRKKAEIEVEGLNFVIMKLNT